MVAQLHGASSQQMDPRCGLLDVVSQILFCRACDDWYLDFKHNTCPLLESGSPHYFQCPQRWSTVGTALKENSPGEVRKTLEHNWARLFQFRCGRGIDRSKCEAAMFSVSVGFVRVRSAEQSCEGSF